MDTILRKDVIVGIDYDGLIYNDGDEINKDKTHTMTVDVNPSAYIPALTEAVLQRLLEQALMGMRYGGSCTLYYDTYLCGSELHATLDVVDLNEADELDEKDEFEFDDEVYEEELPGFWCRFKRFIGIT